MADWDADGPRLAENLKLVLRNARDDARRRKAIRSEIAKAWHRDLMQGLEVPKAEYVGRFRGEEGLEFVGVRIGDKTGVDPREVSKNVDDFERRLKLAAEYLDRQIPQGKMPAATQIDPVLDLCAWTHAEWVRIHPFANGNGRTARLWANFIAMRYGLPPFIQLRPRPEGDAYTGVSERAMTGDWAPTADLFRQLLEEFLPASE